MNTSYSIIKNQDTETAGDKSLRVDFMDPEFFEAVRYGLSSVQRLRVCKGFSVFSPEAEQPLRTMLDREAYSRTPEDAAEREACRLAENEAQAAIIRAEKAEKARAAKETKVAREVKAASMRRMTGDTYPHREAIRAAGGEWDKKAGVWNVPADRFEELQSLVRGGSDLRRQQDADRAAAQAARDAEDAARRLADVALAQAAAEVAQARAAAEAALLAEVASLVAAATEFEDFEGNIGGPYVSDMPRAEAIRADGKRVSITRLCMLSRRKKSGRVDVASIRVPRLPEGWTVRVTYCHCGKPRAELVEGHAAYDC